MSLILSGTDGLSDIDGSAATPAIRGTDANTGIFFPAADTIAFSEGGAEAMRIDSSGNVGIGTSSPSVKLQVAGVAYSSTGGLAVGDGSSFTPSGLNSIPNYGVGFTTTGSITSVTGFGGINFYTAQVERARIDQSGNLLVGTTSSSGARIRVVGSSTDDNTGAFSVLNSNTTAAACAASFITGTNSTATSNVLVKFGMDSYNQGIGQINANGAGAAAFGAFSDRRLKENIVALPPQLDNICALRPVEFDYIESEGGGHQLGFIAQEMQEVYPDAVGDRGDGMLTVTGWDKTIARLVKAIQEQQAIITSLTARVAALEGTQP